MRRLVPAIMAITAVAAGAWAVQTARGAFSAGAVLAEGSWGRAVGVPGLVALNKGGFASVRSVSCAPPGNCAADGFYTDRHDHGQGFVVVERNGRWTTAIGVPGLGALNKSGDASPRSHCGAPR
jgi:hypothetical protein